MSVVAWILLSLVVLLNLVATAFIVRSEFATSLQKAVQLILAWAIPLVGSIIVIAVLKGTSPERKRRVESDSTGNAWLPGEGLESEAAPGHHGSHGEAGADAGHGGDGGH